MKSIRRKRSVPNDTATGKESAGTEVSGLRPARDGLQPVTDLATFLQALPDFGRDADRLLEAIAEDRASRRALLEDRDC